jgi:hypothetical protein
MHTSTKLLSSFSLVVLFHSLALSAPVSTPIRSGQFSPIPLYPSNGVIPAEQADRFVFLDPNTWDLIIAYPENVSDPRFAAHPAQRITRRVALDKHVDPMVYVSFSRDQAGRITYAYSVLNGSRAKQGIAAWHLHVPQAPSSGAAAANGIEKTNAGDSTQLLSGPSAWTLTARTSSLQPSFAWLVSSPEGVISPGAQLAGFNVTSEQLLPGFVRASFSSSAQGSTALAALDVPAPVKTQLASLDAIHFNDQLVLTLGPKFSSDDNKVSRVADFYTGIRILSQSHYLDGNSPFVHEVLQTLKSYLDGVAQSTPVAAEDYPGPELVITHGPGGQLESQIFEAMKLSLDAHLQ